MIRHQYSRLCCLVHNSLHPFTEKSTVSMTKEQEKSLLITISQVLNQIKLWTGEFGSDSASDNGDHGNPWIDISGTTIHGSKCHSYPSECISKIINDLMFLLTVESPYAQHLAGNVLVAISEFVVSSENYWEEFMKSLCSHFKLTIYKTVSPSSKPPTIKHLDHNSSTINLDLQSIWCSASHIISVLRNILKHLKHEEEDDELLEVYFHSFSSCLQNIPWESCNKIPIEFCGHLVQLFCSMVDSDPDTNPVIQEILNIFPRFLTWCLHERGYTSISQYIRYKILVLMIRLSSLVELDCEIIVSWLNLIDKYFQDVLSESLTVDQHLQNDCLKDSPFREEEKENCHRYIQRRVVFLYLKCGFLLITLKERPMNKCSCGDYCSKKGFTAIHEWLKNHVNSEFSKSFLQLYIHEDDMLFEVLLLLTDIPNRITEDPTLHAVFDPVHLFHLFLSEIHYDHQVILDYLISKDTGATCAEYLLRCLRILCDKWNTLREFPSYKRRKIRDSIMSDNATECLLVLKKSVESLHQKDLFPYNPKVLLLRLTRFEELSSMP